MPSFLSAESFIQSSLLQPVVDVRAPIEFAQGHIPGAINLPLFDDEQRADIGTRYKQNGRLPSVIKALEIVGPKMRSLVEAALELAPDNELLVHCWRGGMRSRSIAWLIENVEIKASVLEGGYKSFRQHVLQSFETPLNLIVISGLTGAGKTHQIKLLKSHGEQVIDLEALASHRGSAFGGIGLCSQPTVEQFENNLFHAVSLLDTSKRIWIEDESRNIGSARIPNSFFDQIRSAPAIFMDVGRTMRAKLIESEYGSLCQDELKASIVRITKRMGGQNVNEAIDALSDGRMGQCIELLLDYYDKLYLHNKEKLERKIFVDLVVEDPTSIQATERLIELAESIAKDISIS